MQILQKRSARNLSRRGVLGALAAFPMRVLGERLAGRDLEIDSLGPAIETPGAQRRELRYRVDAVVLLLSLPVFRRAGVGQARMAVAEDGAAVGRRLTIDFAAASDPARAHGIDRAGWFREVVLENDGEPARAATLGVMTDSPEQSVEQARAAFHPGAEDPRYVAIDSASVPGRTRSRVIHFHQPRAQSATNESWPDSVRRIFQREVPEWKETDWASGEKRAPRTFLYAILRALEHPGVAAQTFYVFNENRYRLEMASAADPERGKQFAAARLTSAPERILRVHGVIENLTKRTHPTHLQVWVDAGASVPLPIRVEFEPRSFLRLALEALPKPPAAESKEQI